MPVFLSLDRLKNWKCIDNFLNSVELLLQNSDLKYGMIDIKSPFPPNSTGSTLLFYFYPYPCYLFPLLSKLAVLYLPYNQM